MHAGQSDEKQPMSPPPVAPRNPAAFRMFRLGSSGPPPSPGYRVNGFGRETSFMSTTQAEREVKILNHCIDDIERFMGKLQQVAEASSVQRRRKSKKKGQADDLISRKAIPPKEEEFIDIFQKIKYSFCLLARLKSSISNPSAEELLHHVFVPLDLMVNTTQGPALGAGVASPALTGGAIALLEKHLTDRERQLWVALGPKWTLPRSQLGEAVSSYTPLFLDGWTPEPFDPEGQPWDDPIELQHKQENLKDRIKHSSSVLMGLPPSPGKVNRDTETPIPEGETYICSYDFVARNSNELSVLHGEKLEVIESSKRWWKCRNGYGQIGFVPFNILEPASALEDTHKEEPAVSPKSKASNRRLSYIPSSHSESPDVQPRSPGPYSQPLETDKVLVMNAELLEKLARRRTLQALATPNTQDTRQAPGLEEMKEKQKVKEITAETF
ncbi:epidermal growth factor receptor kinase substrate 8-like protein 1a isoform X2 [Paramormyrops kingsleyae]|uniref:epidermal growth factor receptor kinase substrate 8-like protein 1a isoform X2 n=1 Tax=Paramormyrops kingsleyae TaxID=1676925 RepID=UPI000CD603A9|nr:epidermal growth factor receptor kinase substrate 8-like protein 1 isoform X2 [Paramormyrops kingsleyae]